MFNKTVADDSATMTPLTHTVSIALQRSHEGENNQILLLLHKMLCFWLMRASAQRNIAAV